MMAFVLMSRPFRTDDDNHLVDSVSRGKEENFRSERRSLEETFNEGKRRVDALIECRSRYLPWQHDNKVDLAT